MYLFKFERDGAISIDRERSLGVKLLIAHDTGGALAYMQ